MNNDILMDMQNDQIAIGFAPHLIHAIKNGTKTSTYRLGDKYTFLQKGDKIAIRDSSTDEIFADIEITEKSETIFKNTT